MTARTTFRLAGALAVFCARALAHHSFAAEFDANKTIWLHGIVSRLEWTNPHTLIYISAEGADHRFTEWMVEGAAPNAMARRGLSKNDFAPGSSIAIEGEQARDGSNRMNGLSVTLKDGRTLAIRNEGELKKD